MKYTARHTESLEILQADDFKVLYEAAKRNWRYELSMWGCAQRIELGFTKGDSLEIEGSPIYVFEAIEENQKGKDAVAPEILRCKPDALGNYPCDYGYLCDKCKLG